MKYHVTIKGLFCIELHSIYYVACFFYFLLFKLQEGVGYFLYSFIFVQILKQNFHSNRWIFWLFNFANFNFHFRDFNSVFLHRIICSSQPILFNYILFMSQHKINLLLIFRNLTSILCFQIWSCAFPFLFLCISQSMYSVYIFPMFVQCRKWFYLNLQSFQICCFILYS